MKRNSASIACSGRRLSTTVIRPRLLAVHHQLGAHPLGRPAVALARGQLAQAALPADEMLHEGELGGLEPHQLVAFRLHQRPPTPMRTNLDRHDAILVRIWSAPATGIGCARGSALASFPAIGSSHSGRIACSARRCGAASRSGAWAPSGIRSGCSPISQKKLQADLIELCRTTLRENAVESDKKLLFPRKNFQAHGQARPSGPDRAQGAGRHGREPCLRRDGGRDHRPLRLRRRPPCATPCIWARSPPRCCATTTASPCRTSSRASTRTAWSARSPTPIPRPASHFWYPMSSGAERTDGRLEGQARRRPGPPRAASPTGTSSRPPAPTSTATTPTSPAF